MEMPMHTPWTPSSRALLLALAVGTLTAPPALGETLHWRDFLPLGPTFQRPTEDLSALAPGDPVQYSVLSLFVDRSGTYTLDSSFGLFGVPFDGMLFLYAGSFDPQQPLVNLVAAGDDGPQPGTARVETTLAAGVIYRVVTTAKGEVEDAFGFHNQVTGPGEIRFNGCFLDEEDRNSFFDDEMAVAGGRFCVGATWRDFDGHSGEAKLVSHRTDASGQLWFFSEDNVELSFMMLDGCALNGHYWFLLAGTTSVEFTVTVRDVQRGAISKTYRNALGRPATTVLDTRAFACE
jgi:hypothetical protein